MNFIMIIILIKLIKNVLIIGIIKYVLGELLYFLVIIFKFVMVFGVVLSLCLIKLFIIIVVL